MKLNILDIDYRIQEETGRGLVELSNQLITALA